MSKIPKGIQNGLKKKCEGGCEENGKKHFGKVVSVRILGWKYPLKANYCKTAIKIDESRGFVVKVLS